MSAEALWFLVAAVFCIAYMLAKTYDEQRRHNRAMESMTKMVAMSAPAGLTMREREAQELCDQFDRDVDELLKANHPAEQDQSAPAGSAP